MPLLLAKLPDEQALQRLLDVPSLIEVAAEVNAPLIVINDDGTHYDVPAPTS
ncbi:MAG TPA: hypothetical protein VHK64_06220 [Nocardioidaceae bacterium]|jgi:hypothetical protein|nr:hypothetical protein [Nocardioidaceae bacterium]